MLKSEGQHHEFAASVAAVDCSNIGGRGSSVGSSTAVSGGGGSDGSGGRGDVVPRSSWRLPEGVLGTT